MKEEEPTITESNTRVMPKILQKESLSLQDQIDYVKKHFKSEGLFLTLDIKKVSGTQASLHGVLYEINRDVEPEEDELVAEGMMACHISDQS